MLDLPGSLGLYLLIQIPDTVSIVVLPSECNLVHFTKVVLGALKAIFTKVVLGHFHLLCSGLWLCQVKSGVSNPERHRSCLDLFLGSPTCRNLRIFPSDCLGSWLNIKNSDWESKRRLSPKWRLSLIPSRRWEIANVDDEGAALKHALNVKCRYNMLLTEYEKQVSRKVVKYLKSVNRAYWWYPDFLSKAYGSKISQCDGRLRGGLLQSDDEKDFWKMMTAMKVAWRDKKRTAYRQN